MNKILISSGLIFLITALVIFINETKKKSCGILWCCPEGYKCVMGISGLKCIPNNANECGTGYCPDWGVCFLKKCAPKGSKYCYTGYCKEKDTCDILRSGRTYNFFGCFKNLETGEYSDPIALKKDPSTPKSPESCK